VAVAPLPAYNAPQRVTIAEAKVVYLANRQAMVSHATFRKHRTFAKQLEAFGTSRGYVLALGGGMVQAGVPWTDGRDAFRGSDQTFVGDRHAANEHHDLWRAIEVSTRALSDGDRRRLSEQDPG
jgi:hypothetical protein